MQSLSEKASKFISKDHEFVSEYIPPAAVITISDIYITVVIMVNI